MTKEELSELLHSLEIQVNEGITSPDYMGNEPRIVYWPYVEQDIMASGEGYDNLVTYQISFYARTPQRKKYKEFRKKLREKGLHPTFYHEYVEKDSIFEKTWHTYCAVDVIEEIEDE